MEFSGYRFADRTDFRDRKEYERTLYHEAAHLRSQGAEPVSFYILREKSNALAGEIHFFIREHKALSPLRAPFGSFLLKKKLPVPVLDRFILYCEEELRKKGVKDVSLIHAPYDYCADVYAILHPLLFQREYQVVRADISALIPVSEGSIEGRLADWERRKLRHARQAGLSFRRYAIEELTDVYDFIAGCRTTKGYSLSMQSEEVKRLSEVFPDRMYLFGVLDQKRLVAAALCLRVLGEVLYTFYYDHDPEYDEVSPVVMLLEGIYSRTYSENIRWIDLGTSSVDGSLRFSLLTFKLNVGARPSPKYTFQKRL
jgi:hypothetical protein